MASVEPTSYSVAKAESFSSKIGNKTRIPTFTTCIQHHSGSPSQRNKARRRRNKNHPNEKGELKSSLYIESPEDCISKC